MTKKSNPSNVASALAFFVGMTGLIIIAFQNWKIALGLFLYGGMLIDQSLTVVKKVLVPVFSNLFISKNELREAIQNERNETVIMYKASKSVRKGELVPLDVVKVN